jgi:uncharacterized membrane protein
MTFFQLTLFGPNGVDPTTLDANGVLELVLRLVNWATALIGVVVFIMLLLAAFNYTKAAGNEQERAGAKKAIQWSIIGLIVVILAFTGINAVLKLLKCNASIKSNLSSAVQLPGCN